GLRRRRHGRTPRRRPQSHSRGAEAGQGAMQATGPLTNLPLRRTALIGRDQDLAAVCELIPLAEGRLLTLTGAGGSGKTSLALEAARGLLVRLVDGVWLVELAPLADPLLVPQAVAAALGLREGSGR